MHLKYSIYGHLESDFLFCVLGFWKDKQQLKKLSKTDIVFKPKKELKEYELAMDNWIKAVQRSLHWYSQTSQ